MRSTQREAFDTVVNGHELCIEFDRTTVWGREHYGADADGNRGMWITCIDDESTENIKVTWYTDVGNREQPLDELEKDLQTQVLTAVEQYCETHEAAPVEEQEPDYDDIDE